MKTIKLKVSKLTDVKNLLGDIALSGYRTWFETEIKNPLENGWTTLEQYVYIEVPDEAVM